MDVQRARAALEEALYAKARFVRRTGSLCALVIIVGIILIFAAPKDRDDEVPVGWQVAQAATFLPGFAGMGMLGFYSMPFVSVGRRVLDHPAGDGRVEIRFGGRQLWLDLWPSATARGSAPLTGRLVHNGIKGWPEGEVPAVLFGDPTAAGALMAVVQKPDGDASAWVVGTSRLRAL